MEHSSAGQAAKYRDLGFTNVKALAGGVEGWKNAGFAMAACEPPVAEPGA